MKIHFSRYINGKIVYLDDYEYPSTDLQINYYHSYYFKIRSYSIEYWVNTTTYKNSGDDLSMLSYLNEAISLRRNIKLKELSIYENTF